MFDLWCFFSLVALILVNTEAKLDLTGITSSSSTSSLFSTSASIVISLIIIVSEQFGDDPWLDPTKEGDITVFDSYAAPCDCCVDQLLASVQLAEGTFKVWVLSTFLHKMLKIG